jgi:hypothetical protein
MQLSIAIIRLYSSKCNAYTGFRGSALGLFTAANQPRLILLRRNIMNAFKFLAAAAILAAAGSTIAADLPVTSAAASAAAANAGVAATQLNVPSVTISNPQARSRAEVRAEAVEFVRNHKTALAILLDHSK